jgi:predicted dinucleotide-binding enzyme
MTTISIIGSGNMASAIGTRAAKHGHTIEFMSRNTAKAQALADQIGNGATVGTFGARPAGDIVIVAVLYGGAVEVVEHYGDALAGKTLVDITNPFNADASGVVTTAGNSVSEQIAAAAPEGAHVVKAFNTIFQGVLAVEKPVDVFFAGDSVEAKARFAAFVESLDMRARDKGGSRWPTPSNGPASSWSAWRATEPASNSPLALRSAENRGRILRLCMKEGP